MREDLPFNYSLCNLNMGNCKVKSLNLLIMNSLKNLLLFIVCLILSLRLNEIYSFFYFASVSFSVFKFSIFKKNLFLFEINVLNL